MRDIPGYEGLYAATEDGRIWSYPKGNRNTKGCFLKPGTDNHGYIIAGLHKGKKRKTCKVHQLVALTYLGEKPEGCQVCHNNGIRTDNRVENLRYDTLSNNMQDKKKHGTIPDFKGENHPQAKLTDNEVRAIRIMYVTGEYSQRKLANLFDVSQCMIVKIISREVWKHIY